MSATLVGVALRSGGDLAGFREAARALVGRGVPPEAVVWRCGAANDLFCRPLPVDTAPLLLPRNACELIGTVVCHSDPERYALLYALIWRLVQGEKSLLQVASDPLIHRLRRLAKSVHRDIHGMHAHVRFRRLETRGPDGRSAERFVAWFEPDHWIVERAASFFVDRFRGMDWTILTPKGSLHWDTHGLTLGPPGERGQAPADDDLEPAWLAYYESIFNPARLNPNVMRGHMPVKYWRNLPEAATISGLIREAPQRVQAMVDQRIETPVKRNPDKAVAAMADQAPKSLEALNRQILDSEPPPSFSRRTVLGEGPEGAAIALVGEQPGDQEDREGRPFVGPAGQLLDKALAAAGIDRAQTYVTNAVKNFKFKAVGKRRIHQTPTSGEIKHYRWWLERELEFIRPHLVVALGSSATLAMAGKPMPVMKNRGPTDQFAGWKGFITVHPSSLLRQPDEAAKSAGYERFVEDLKEIRTLAA